MVCIFQLRSCCCGCCGFITKTVVRRNDNRFRLHAVFLLVLFFLVVVVVVRVEKGLEIRRVRGGCQGGETLYGGLLLDFLRKQAACCRFRIVIFVFLNDRQHGMRWSVKQRSRCGCGCGWNEARSVRARAVVVVEGRTCARIGVLARSRILHHMMSTTTTTTHRMIHGQKVMVMKGAGMLWSGKGMKHSRGLNNGRGGRRVHSQQPPAMLRWLRVSLDDTTHKRRREGANTHRMAHTTDTTTTKPKTRQSAKLCA